MQFSYMQLSIHIILFPGKILYVKNDFLIARALLLKKMVFSSTRSCIQIFGSQLKKTLCRYYLLSKLIYTHWKIFVEFKKL